MIKQKSITVNVAVADKMGEEPLVVMRFLTKDFQLGSQTIVLGREELCTQNIYGMSGASLNFKLLWFFFFFLICIF